MKIQTTRLAAAAATTILALSALQPATAQYQDRQDQRNSQYQNDRNDQERRNEQYNRNEQNGRNEQDRRYEDRRESDRHDDRSQLWQQRYSRIYTTNDDVYYQQCARSADPAGVIAGALIGGLIGNAAGQGNGGATVAGIILGGAAGGSLMRNLSCEDRSYSYKAYYDGFNAGRPNQQYSWRNPRSGRRGVVQIGTYYNDPDGFRCATFSQSIYIQGRAQQGRGRACQQPDGTWAIVG